MTFTFVDSLPKNIKQIVFAIKVEGQETNEKEYIQNFFWRFFSSFTCPRHDSITFLLYIQIIQDSGLFNYTFSL